MSSPVQYEIKQVRNILDTSIKAHLAAKGQLCDCCELPKALCRCYSAENLRKRQADILKHFSKGEIKQ